MIDTKVTLDGNFFRRDPGKTLRGNVADLMEKLAEAGEQMVKQDIGAHRGSMPGYSGWSYDNTVGRTRSLKGKHWDTWARISANTEGMSRDDAIRTKAAAATIERRWHPYRKAKSAIGRARSIFTANLTQGLE